ncbi:MAG: rhodanese-like domain-containing protein [Thermodesulfobacteriota bacterium]
MRWRHDTTVVACRIALVLLLLWAGNSAGQELPVIHTDQLKSLLDSGQEILLLDARTAAEFEARHIRTAVNIHPDQRSDLGRLLPPERSTLLVIYSNGRHSETALALARAAAALGFANIRLYSEGLVVWEERGLPMVIGPEADRSAPAPVLRVDPVQLSGSLASGDWVIVDLRDLASFNDGHLPEATSIPVEVLAHRSDTLPRDKKIVLYGEEAAIRSGARKLALLSFPAVFQLSLAEWTAAGLPLAAGSCH